MPFSEGYGKNIIKEWFDVQKDIKTIIDVGPGSGTYAKLLGPKYKYIGIEIWAPYVDKYNLHELYQEVIIGDIRHVMFPQGDCIIFGDIVEHMPKNDAHDVLVRAISRYKHMVVSIPIGYFHQSQSEDNKFEAHLSFWTFEELQSILQFPVQKMDKDIGIFIK